RVRSGERKRKREEIAADVRVDGAEHLRMAFHQPDAAHRQPSEQGREEDARLDQRLTLLTAPSHRTSPSDRVTNTAAPDAAPRFCIASEIAELRFRNVSSPPSRASDFSVYPSAASADR